MAILTVHSLTHSITFSNSFIMIRFVVGPMSGTLDVRQEYLLDGSPYHHKAILKTVNKNTVCNLICAFI